MTMFHHSFFVYKKKFQKNVTFFDFLQEFGHKKSYVIYRGDLIA